MKPAFTNIKTISGIESQNMRSQNVNGFIFARNIGVIRHIQALMI